MLPPILYDYAHVCDLTAPVGSGLYISGGGPTTPRLSVPATDIVHTYACDLTDRVSSLVILVVAAC